MTPPRAHLEQQSDGYWRVCVDGVGCVLADESYGVAAAVEYAINNPARREPTEAYDAAETITRGKQLLSEGRY